MALCRARPVFGPAAARRQLAELVRGVLETPRDPAKLHADVLAMRGEISAHKPPAGPLDAKLLRGGLVDCEFIVHELQLRERIAFHPRLQDAIAELVEAGLLPASFAANHLLLARLLVAARLFAPDGAEPPLAAQAALARACEQPDYAALLRALGEARQGVAQCWAELFGEPLEIA
jgi:glutamate-ammonia-ligase adenylyltransferase